MDWDLVIERNVRLLGPIVATLCIMAGIFSSPLEGEDGPARRGKAEALAGPGEGYLPSPTLPRRIHRAVYRLLRAAEAAVRRLIVVVGRDIVAAEPVLPPLKQNNGPLVTHIPVRPGLGLACAAPAEAPPEPPAVRKLSFPLLDPLRDPDAPPFRIRTSGVPRISFPGWTPLFHVAPRHDPLPNDPIDAGYLRLRLDALSRALSDLPRQAMRLARWQARRVALRKAGRAGRLSPLRPGPAYGLRRPGSPRPEHEIDDILRDLHYFAWEARRDTS
ncbi:MAG: hypothetical protein KF694_07110 [Mesorhizobium sp.]|nr:hypothetical protein [Mesorhizobium sp.]